MRKSRLALPLGIFALSSSHSGTLSIQRVPGSLGTNGKIGSVTADAETTMACVLAAANPSFQPGRLQDGGGVGQPEDDHHIRLEAHEHAPQGSGAPGVPITKGWIPMTTVVASRVASARASRASSDT